VIVALKRKANLVAIALIVSFAVATIVVAVLAVSPSDEPPVTFKERFGIWSSVTHRLPRAPLMRWDLSKII
jgi:hypothetical protein